MPADTHTLTCRELVDFLADYLSGALPEEMRAPFEAHLTACAECLTYLGSYRATVRLVQDACRDGDQLPPDLPDALVRAILAARRGAVLPAGGSARRR